MAISKTRCSVRRRLREYTKVILHNLNFINRKLSRKLVENLTPGGKLVGGLKQI